MKKGRVLIGFSAPFVGLYSCEGGKITFTDGMRLARGVDVNISPEIANNNVFHADGVVAESESGKFKSGTLKYTVDGLLDAAERFIYGLPEPEKMAVGEKQVNVIKYGDNANPPYVGTGFVVAYQSDGVVTYQPIILPKVKFITHGTEAKTKEEEKNWQTQIIEASICRDDTANCDWKWLFEEQATEAEAIAILTAVFNVAQPAEG